MVKLMSVNDSPSGSYEFETGVYEAELTNYDGPKPSPKWSGEVLIIDWDAPDMEYEGDLNCMVGYTMKPNKNFCLYDIMCALTGRKVDPDEELDLDDYIGTRVQLTIGENIKQGKNGTPVSYPKITAVSPIRKKGAAKGPKVARPVEPEPEEEDESDDDDLDGTPFKRNR